jgi:hypothetical protein
MANTYDNIMSTNNVDLWAEISRVLLLIMYSLLSKAVTGYHFVKDKYLEYKYAVDADAELKPTDRYFLTPDGRDNNVDGVDQVPERWVYLEEWVDSKGTKKMLVHYEGDLVPIVWGMSPFEKPPAKCPWVWVGDKETEIDLTRTFDKFLVPGNVLKKELVSKLIKMTDHTDLIYIETKTFNQVKFPGEGITIEADVE